MRFLGVDLHKIQFTVCTIEDGTSSVDTYSLKHLDEFKQELRPDDLVAVETTENAYFFIQEIEPYLLRPVKEINTRKFKVISDSHKKTDENDAQLIALYLSKDLLPEVRRKSQEQKETLKLANLRDQLVKTKTAFINQIHSALNGVGIRVKKKSLVHKKNLDALLGLDISATTMCVVKILVKQVLNALESIKELEKALEKSAQQIEGYENIVSIKGIGEVSAAILISIIGEIKDFDNEKKLASYLGIVPFTKNSADTERSGRITKRGNSMARKTLVQCAFVAIKYSPYLNDFYREKKKTKGTGKAIVATARRLLTIIYHALKNKRIYTDFEKNEYITQ